MVLPQLADIQDQVTYTNAFLGLNKTNSITDQEFSDMKNLTNDYYPTIGTRKKRGFIREMENPQCVIGGRYLSYVDADKFYFDEGYVCDLDKLAAGVKRQMVQMGAYILILPDGLLYNTYTNTHEFIKIDRTTTENPTFTLCKLDGTLYDTNKIETGTEAPEDTSKYWLDTSSDTVVLKIYSSSQSQWVSVGTTYVRIAATGIGEGLSAYDAATLSGVDKTSAIYNNWDFNTSNIVYACGSDFIVVAGLIDKVFTNSKPITIKRDIPDMDYVCELDNRIWGCSSENHEIYACKLGDPKNWYFYGGLDSDSYAVTVGTQNVFTGCVAYSGTVLFFKEDGFHRIYGTKPSNFEVTWKPGRGVQQGSGASLAIVNEVLFFKARDSVCAYDGSTETMSEKIDTDQYYDAVGVGYRNKYYVSMRDLDYNYKNYTYDMSKGTWIIEDEKKIKYMTYSNNGLYLIDNNNQMYVTSNEAISSKWFPGDDRFPEEGVYPGNEVGRSTEEGTFEWYMTTGEIGLDSPYQKYIKRIDVRMELDTDAKIKFEIMYDSSDTWESIMEYYCTKKRSYTIPLVVKRCDHMKLRMSGFGTMRLLSIAKHIEQGSEN